MRYFPIVAFIFGVLVIMNPDFIEHKTVIYAFIEGNGPCAVRHELSDRSFSHLCVKVESEWRLFKMCNQTTLRCQSEQLHRFVIFHIYISNLSPFIGLRVVCEHKEKVQRCVHIQMWLNDSETISCRFAHWNHHFFSTGTRQHFCTTEVVFFFPFLKQPWALN